MRSRALLPVSALLAASAWCLVLLGVRRHEYGAAGYHYLAWNLTLAWVPLVLALVLLPHTSGVRTGSSSSLGGSPV